jgi:hypothetical protein
MRTQLILLLGLGQVLSAQNADEILHRYLEAMKANGPRAAQYTWVEDDTHFSYDKTGVARQTSSETWEVILVEGENYKKLVARNGQPLSARSGKGREKTPGRSQGTAQATPIGLVPPDLLGLRYR